MDSYSFNLEKLILDGFITIEFDNGRILDHCSQALGDLKLFRKNLYESNNYFIYHGILRLQPLQ